MKTGLEALVTKTCMEWKVLIQNGKKAGKWNRNSVARFTMVRENYESAIRDMRNRTMAEFSCLVSVTRCPRSFDPITFFLLLVAILRMNERGKRATRNKVYVTTFELLPVLLNHSPLLTMGIECCIKCICS